MRDLGRRLLIGLAVAAAGATAIGYAFIFSGVASPPGGDLGMLVLPAAGEASAELLDDGRPVFVVNDPDAGARVFDARGREPTGALSGLVAWCPASGTFVDPLDGSAYTAAGELIDGPVESGLVAFVTRPSGEDPSRIVVGSDTVTQGRADAASGRSDGCTEGLVAHAPAPGETFDPSVAADEEPPGWIWLEGTLRVVDGEVRLCDAAEDACEGHAEISGIDPATLVGDADSVGGRFIGRVRDGAIEGLSHVPGQAEAP